MKKPTIKKTCLQPNEPEKRIGDSISWVSKKTKNRVVTVDAHEGVVLAFRTVRQALCQEGKKATWVDLEVVEGTVVKF